MEKIKILFVDRDRALLDFCVSYFNKQSLNDIVTTTSFNDAQSRIKNQKFNLLITSHKINEDDFQKNGNALAQELRKSNSSAVTILVTGKPDLNFFEELESGFDAVLVKPYGLDQFTKLIQTLMPRIEGTHVMGKQPSEAEIENIYKYLATDAFLGGASPERVRLQVLKTLRRKYPSLSDESLTDIGTRVVFIGLESALTSALHLLSIEPGSNDKPPPAP